jgi:hypothetical protein
MEEVPFRAPGQRITLLLLAFVCDLLALGQTFKAVSLTAGLHKNVVKAIHRPGKAFWALHGRRRQRKDAPEAGAAGKVSGRRYVQAAQWLPVRHRDHRP